jgi:hypothetical protein
MAPARWDGAAMPPRPFGIMGKPTQRSLTEGAGRASGTAGAPIAVRSLSVTSSKMSPLGQVGTVKGLFRKVSNEPNAVDQVVSICLSANSIFSGRPR